MLSRWLTQYATLSANTGLQQSVRQFYGIFHVKALKDLLILTFDFLTSKWHDWLRLGLLSVTRTLINYVFFAFSFLSYINPYGT